MLRNTKEIASKERKLSALLENGNKPFPRKKMQQKLIYACFLTFLAFLRFLALSIYSQVRQLAELASSLRKIAILYNNNDKPT